MIVTWIFYYYYLIIDILFSFLTSFITTIGLKTAFYGLLSRFGFLVLSLYSFVFHFFQDDWINFCFIIDFLTFVFYEFQLKNCCDRSGETNFWSTCLRTEQVWFILRFSNFQIWLLLAFYFSTSFNLNSAVNLLKVSILEAFYHLLNRFGFLYKYVLHVCTYICACIAHWT